MKKLNKQEVQALSRSVYNDMMKSGKIKTTRDKILKDAIAFYKKIKTKYKKDIEVFKNMDPIFE